MNGYDPYRIMQARRMTGQSIGNIIRALIPLFSERARKEWKEKEKLANLTRKQQIANILGMAYDNVPPTEVIKYKTREQAIRGLGFTPELVRSIMFPELSKKALRESQMKLHEKQIEAEKARIEHYGKMAGLEKDKIEAMKDYRQKMYNLDVKRWEREKKHMEIMENKGIGSEIKNLYATQSRMLLDRYDRIQRAAQAKCGPMPLEGGGLPVDPQTGAIVAKGTKGAITRMEYWKRCMEGANKQLESIDKQLKIIENMAFKVSGIPIIPEPEPAPTPSPGSSSTSKGGVTKTKEKSWKEKWNEFWENWENSSSSPLIPGPTQNFSEEYKREQELKRQKTTNFLKSLLGITG